MNPVEHNVPVIFVDPRNTSLTCPRCGSKFSYTYRLAICPRCRFMADRDVVGVINIWYRVLYAYAEVLWVTSECSHNEQ